MRVCVDCACRTYVRGYVLSGDCIQYSEVTEIKTAVVFPPLALALFLSLSLPLALALNLSIAIAVDAQCTHHQTYL